MLRDIGGGDPPSGGGGGPAGLEMLIHFGPFSLSPTRRVLLESGQPVRLGSRALEILLFLIENAGKFVSNTEIFKRVWPRNVVVEGNLRVHIASLRRAIGDGQEGRRYIINVPNRGYSFVAELFRSSAAVPAPPSAQTRGMQPAPGGFVPSPLSRVIGQEAAIQTLVQQIARRRLVTLVGTGGIGKTTVAMAVATREDVAAQWSGVHFVDLASHSDPALVPAALASALGLGSLVGDALSSLVAFLHDKRLLLLLDNCEHLIGPVATLIEDILRRAPGVHVLATSREPLGAQGEWVQRLPPLTMPPAGAGLSARQLLAFSAVELLVERCAASVDQFSLQDSDAAAAEAICRRLDGLPLAIELAAARVGSLGLKAVAEALDDRFAMLNKGRRTAVPRHRSLRATLDWSFELLSDAERRLLLRLSVFAGPFTLDAALAVAVSPDLAQEEAVDAITELVAKSLLTVDAGGEELSFRLLETTRAYAAERLAPVDVESARLRRLHAQHFLAALERSEEAWRTMLPADFMAAFGGHVDDVRAALNWCFQSGGDLSLGIALVVKAAALFFQMSFTDEHRQYVEAAMAELARSGHRIEPRLELELNVIAGHVIFNAHGLHPDRDRAFAKALELAEQIGDAHLMAVTRSTQWMGAYQASDPGLMLLHAQQYEILTAGTSDVALQLHRDRIFAPTLHLLGAQREAAACCERGLAEPALTRVPFLAGVRIDRRVAMGAIHARVLWLLGLPEQAERAVRQAIDAAERAHEPVALASALASSACPLAIWCGRIELARERLDRLLRLTAERALTVWHGYGRAFEVYIRWREQGAQGLPPPLPSSVERVPQLSQLLATFHPHYVTDRLVGIGEAGLAGWCRCELQRVAAERLRATDAVAAERLLVETHALALREGTLPWALRTAVSLAAAARARGEPQAAIEVLESTLALVSEGFDTQDAVAARAASIEAKALLDAPR
ncbi:winged helix-turn-helix domain-containing protein [Variovorax sp. TBS-050B]|uniref:ATP-binding protein n=1 Tax=Variovorax sp. TBS-050B TaxID=2940551 RepID=UPI0024764021|nr:winged helix-turn-helix domain-containing protein [Variovorax sp. TBS-050B]